jgi:thymidylate kinase
MLLILEGIDKCGKTTFANKFAEIAEIVHCTKDDDMFLVLQNAAKTAAGKLVILDRNFLSEMCYGPVYRGTSQITPVKLMRIRSILSKIDYAILYFSRPLDELKHYDMNDEFEKDAEKLMQVRKLYENYIAKYKNKFNIYEIQYK